MRSLLICTLFIIVTQYFDGTDAFSVKPVLCSTSTEIRRKASVRFAKGNDGEDDPIECYVVEDPDVPIEGEIICTSEKEEFAWFEGVDPDLMKPTDGMESGSKECVEESSPKGNPEWHCH